MPALVAWIDGRKVGEFSEEHLPDGSLFAFEYDAGATTRDLVSLTMVPLPAARRFETRSFPAPFDMILPEGEHRLRIEAARKIIRTDPFSLLAYVGANPVNRVRFLPLGAAPEAAMPELPPPREIAECSQGRALFRRLTEDLELRQGIAGVQPKVLGWSSAASKLSPELRQNRGSTHILKSSPSRFPFLAVNEYVCLRIFAAAGLSVPKVTLSADGELLLVERFDVLPDGSHLGFEEAAALMGENSATKYQRDYGSLLDSLAAFVVPEAEGCLRRDLTQALILNHLIGNGDAHLKNFGMLYSDDTDAKLAPFYDCVATLPYIPGDIPALPLSFDWYSKAWWPRAKLEEFAQTHGKLSRAETRRLIERCLAAMSDGIASLPAHARDIPQFSDMSRDLAALWKKRMRAFA
jgi:serine/threonine-protein kinase HipA